MKFAEHLSAHITPEWRKQYIQYDMMKMLLYEAVERAPSAEEADETVIKRYFSRFNENFMQLCDKELTKINRFFLEKLAEAQRKYESLFSELQAFIYFEERELKHVEEKKSKTVLLGFNRVDTNIRHRHELSLAFSEFYLSLVLLQNYQKLNAMGFRKILKKHDKVLTSTTGAEWYQVNVENATFFVNKVVDKLLTDVEEQVTSRLEGGDRSKAMKRLRVPPLGVEAHPWTNFRLGLWLGMFLMGVACGTGGFITGSHNRHWLKVLPIFRGSFLLLLHVFLVGVNTLGWRTSGVNHILIFEVDPRYHLSTSHLLELASLLSLVWIGNALVFMYSDILGVDPMVPPILMYGIYIVFIFNPFRCCYYSTRRWFLRVLYRVVTAPFHPVRFADFWMADQITSLSLPILDCLYTLCFYIAEVNWLSNPRPGVCSSDLYGVHTIFRLLPYWWRFAQCCRRYRDHRLIVPHFANACKYASSFFVICTETLYIHYLGGTPLFAVTIATRTISTMYVLIWDIKMDWGLFDTNAGENTFLREEIVYHYKLFYYFGLFQNLIIRFKWISEYVVREHNLWHMALLHTVLSITEVFRRYLWNYFRLENEHLNNCGLFRAVRDISIGPLKSSTEQAIIDLMDSEEGIDPRPYKQKPTKARDRHSLWSRQSDEELEGKDEGKPPSPKGGTISPSSSGDKKYN